MSKRLRRSSVLLSFLAVTAAAADPCRGQDAAAGSETAAASAGFLSWVATPPMGWNSWDAFGTTITEAQVKEQADFMAAQLLPHGWRILTVDIQWYEPGASGHSYRTDAPLAMDEWGRLLPAPNRFPSAAGGAGFRPLADYVHAKGLQFGIHLMRGVPRLAVARKLPVKGTSVSAADVADRASTCPWNPDMYGVDMGKPGAQAYYDSVFELIASWGVDFVKVDDISRPYHEREREIEAIRRAIDRTGRPIVLSLSPGETALTAADHVKRHANMWRISDDFWDTWPALLEQFGRLARWSPHCGPGHWPDADMLPLGVLDLGRRSSRFTPDEQRTLMTLWSIARSPLIHGGARPTATSRSSTRVTARRPGSGRRQAPRARRSASPWQSWGCRGAAACAISGRTRPFLPPSASSSRSSRGTARCSAGCLLSDELRTTHTAGELAPRGSRPPRAGLRPLVEVGGEVALDGRKQRERRAAG